MLLMEAKYDFIKNFDKEWKYLRDCGCETDDLLEYAQATYLEDCCENYHRESYEIIKALKETPKAFIGIMLNMTPEGKLFWTAFMNSDLKGLIEFKAETFREIIQETNEKYKELA